MSQLGTTRFSEVPRQVGLQISVLVVSDVIQRYFDKRTEMANALRIGCTTSNQRLLRTPWMEVSR